MALATNRNTPEITGDIFRFAVAAGVRCFAGGIAVIGADGLVKPAVTATGLRAVGCFEAEADNRLGDAGDISVDVRRGTFRFDNAAGADEITIASIGDHCYLVDDHTVARTSGSSTRSVAGKVVHLDELGVYVELGVAVTAAPGGALLAAANLSDVGLAATARANLGANKGALRIGVGSLVGTGVYRTVAPRAGTMTKLYAVIDHALATGNATLTAKIGATPVTNGVITVVEAGSAAGQVNNATPTANNAFAAGDVISVTVGGTNSDADATAEVVVEFTY